MHEAGQRHEHESETDTDTPEVLRPAVGGPTEGEHAGEHQGRADQGHVERQQLGQERGTYIGAQHDGERRSQGDHAGRCEGGRKQSGRGAALEQGGDPQPGEKRMQAVIEIPSQPVPQHGAEAPLHSGADHVGAPQ